MVLPAVRRTNPPAPGAPNAACLTNLDRGGLTRPGLACKSPLVTVKLARPSLLSGFRVKGFCDSNWQPAFCLGKLVVVLHLAMIQLISKGCIICNAILLPASAMQRFLNAASGAG